MNDFTLKPYYLMIANNVTIMLIFIIELNKLQEKTSWAFLVLALQLQVVFASWAIGYQLFEWILVIKLVWF